MPSSKGERGKRLSVWIGADELWLLEMLEKRVQASEALGIPSSQGEEVRAILKEKLKKDYERMYGIRRK